MFLFFVKSTFVIDLQSLAILKAQVYDKRRNLLGVVRKYKSKH